MKSNFLIMFHLEELLINEIKKTKIDINLECIEIEEYINNEVELR